MIQREDQDGVALLRIEHGKANAIDLELLTELTAHLDDLERDRPGAVVVTGTGAVFSAGVDLFRLVDGGPDYVAAFLEALSTSLRRLFATPLPVVAAVNGHAIAGGCILSCAADRRVLVEEGAKMGLTEVAVGVPFPVDALDIVRALLAPQHAQDLVLTGRLLEPAEARAVGLVEELAPREGLLGRALAAARGLAAIPEATFAHTKRQLRGPTLDALDARAAAFDADAARIWESPHTHERIRAYMDRTVGRRG